ncbi:MAG: hypothetical protein K0Q72_1129 [Armatimonadetes bacterium]|nr:hypothetical protein [Armatimonadota bacterium]
MSRKTVTSRISRCLLLPALALMLVGGVVTANRATAGEAGTPLIVRSRGALPTTETVKQMVARDARARRAAVAARRSSGRVLGAPVESGATQKEQAGGLDAGDPAPLGVTAVQGVPAGFNGVSLQDQFNNFGTGFFNPDTSGSIGPSHFVEIINGSLAIYSRTGTLVSHVATSTFFTVVSGGIGYPRNGIQFHRVLYDARSSRWFACGVEGGVNSGFNFQNNQIILAVSRTSDPTGTFDKYVIPVGQPFTATLDFTTVDATLGIDDNGVYVGAHLQQRDVTQGNTVTAWHPVIAATPKASLIAATPSLGAVYVTGPGTLSDMFLSPQVPQNYDAVGPLTPAYVVSTSPVNFGEVIFRTITWTSPTPTLSAFGTVPTPLYGPLRNAVSNNSNGLTLPTGFDDLQGSVVRNGSLWTCRSVGVNASGGSASTNRVGCEWLELQTAAAGTLSLVQSGRVFDPSTAGDPRFYFFPSIAVSGQGHAALGFSGSRAAEFIGAFTCGRLASDPTGTMGAVATVRAGQGGYQITNNGTSSPWGRYSQTSVDPNDDQTLWTIQEYALVPVATGVGNGNWGTWVNRLTAPAPVLGSAGSASGNAGQNGVTFNVTGTGFFDPGAGFTSRPAVAFSGTGISNVVTTVNSATSLTVSLDIASGATLGTRTLTYTNPDGQSSVLPNAFTVAQGASVQLSAGTFSIAENGGSVPVTVQRNGATNTTVSVQLSVAGGTATAGTDFTALNQTITFNPGITSQTVNVNVADDSALEGSETANITLSNPQGGVLSSPSNAVLTITDDTARPTPTNVTAVVLSASSVTVSWTDQSSNETGFVVERSADGGGFTTAATTAANVTSQVVGGLQPGVTNTFRVRAVQGANQSDNSATASIQIATVQLGGSTFSGAEGGSVQVVITRTGGTGSAASAVLATSDGTATAPSDYTAQPSTTVNFGPGETTRTVNILTNADQALEPDETFSISLSAVNGTNTVLGSLATATATITDNPTPVTPTSLTALPVGPTSVRLAWTDNCTNESGYQIERSSGGGAFTPVMTVAANSTTATDASAPAGVAVSYRVRAVNGALQSAPSNEASATIPSGGIAKITPVKLNFAKVRIGASKVLKVTIQNTSKTGSMAGFVSITGTGYSLVSGGGAFNLGPKGKLTVNVGFSPTAAGFAGGTATVLTTAAGRPTTAISLTGTGR